MEPKSYRAIRHDIIRRKQRSNDEEVHHPKEKTDQIKKVLDGRSNLSILELFSGRGNLTKVYEKYGEVEKYDKILGTGDSYLLFHKLIYEKRTFDVIDIDPYGFPNRFYPDIFLLIKDGVMFITTPKPYINIINDMTRQQLMCYYGNSNPDIETIKAKLKLYGLCHWREVKVIDVTDLGRLWRMALSIKKVKATDYTGSKNR